MLRFGSAGTDVLCDWSRPSHVTIFQTITSLFVSFMYASVVADLVVSAAVMQLNSAFYRHTTAA